MINLSTSLSERLTHVWEVCRSSPRHTRRVDLTGTGRASQLPGRNTVSHLCIVRFKGMQALASAGKRHHPTSGSHLERRFIQSVEQRWREIHAGRLLNRLEWQTSYGNTVPSKSNGDGAARVPSPYLLRREPSTEQTEGRLASRVRLRKHGDTGLLQDLIARQCCRLCCKIYVTDLRFCTR